MKPSRQRAFHLPGFIALALCALTCSPALLADLNTGLVAWYPLDGNASDMSGNNNHGTVHGATLGTDRHGAAGKAYSFDGVDDYIKASNNNSSLSLTQSLTISIWIKSNSIHDGPLIYKNKYANATDNDDNYHLKINGSGTAAFSMEKTDDNDFSINSATALSVGTWHQVAALYDGSYFRVYVDGKSSAQKHVGTFTPYSGPGPLQIGSTSLSNHGFISYFHGFIDDVRIYDRALSAAEVAQLYAMESALPAGSVTLNKLAPELSNLLDGNGTIEQALPAGSVIAVKPGDPAPVGYTLFQRNEYNATLTWEEKAPVSVARAAYDGVEALGGKIYFVGGANDSGAKNIAERYDPSTNQWEALSPMNAARKGVATAILNGKLYAIGGTRQLSGQGWQGLSSVEIFDPQTGQWSAGPTLPNVVKYGTAKTVSGKILLFGGYVSGNQNSSQVLELDPATNQWTPKASMPTARRGSAVVSIAGKVWVLGGNTGGDTASTATDKVEFYDVETNSWTIGLSLTMARHDPSVWIANNRIYVAGGRASNDSYLNSIEAYDLTTNQWVAIGNLPENKRAADAAILDGKVYVVAGIRNTNTHSNKVFAADLPPPAMDLYFRDGNATAEAATEPALDGNLSITLNMLAPDALAKLDASRTHAQSAGSVLAIPKDSSPPAGYSLYKRSDRPGTLVWEEKAPVAAARYVYNGVDALDGKLYLVGGGGSSTNQKRFERYDPATNQWESLPALAVARADVATAVLDGKLYAIAGEGLTSVEIYDPQTEQWSAGQSLPQEINEATAITVNGKILLISGQNSSNVSTNLVFEFDPVANQWTQKASIPTARRGLKSVLFNGKVWAIGGNDGSSCNKVEIYDPAANSWSAGPSLTNTRNWPCAWVANGKIHVASGLDSGGVFLTSIEVYDPATNQWSAAGTVPEAKFVGDSAILDGKVYMVAGAHSSGVHNAKVFAADITPPMDLYFRDANASGTITLDKFAGAVVSKLDGNASALPPIGVVSAVDHNDAPPTDHVVLERTDRNATHVWEEKASVSVARAVHGGVKVLNGKIYLVGGFDGTPKDIAERYDPDTNQWETLTSMSVAREGLSAAVLNGKLYAIGGQNLSSVEMYDPQTGQWSAGQALPTSVFVGSAIATSGKILLIGGKNPLGQNLDQVLEFDPATNQWSQKAPMPTARHAINLVRFEDKIWAIGGMDASRSKKVEIYDTATNSWTTGPPLTIARSHLSAWLGNGRIYVAGGTDGSLLKSIEAYDPASNQWTLAGNLPENKHATDAAVLNGKIYLGAGQTNIYNYSDKVYAADLIPHRDLYFREANDTVQTPGGNQSPTNLNATATLAFYENQPIGTVVGEFNATDPDAGATLSYNLISGSGDTNNALFTLESNGTLKTATIFNYEHNASNYSIRVQAKDEHNASVTGNFNVSLTDVNEAPPSQTDHNQTDPVPNNNGPNPHVDQNQPVVSQPAPVLYRPLPQALAAQAMGNLQYTFWGSIMADGGSPVTEVAFELADNMLFRNSTLHTATMLAGSPNFSLTLTLEPGKRYYYRAVATNGAGSTNSATKRVITPEDANQWWSDSILSQGGWRTSPWLGTFRPHESGWIYHLKLGWAYAHPDGSGGLWLWVNDHHWMWTQSGVYPYLWKHDTGTWHYLIGTRNGKPVFYDFSTGSTR